LYELEFGKGSILLDGRNVRGLNLADLRRNVVLVPQRARLFEGTIYSNLTYAIGDPDARLVRRALEAVDLAPLIDSLPRGIETWVGEGGVSLSGGQRQRLALARALLARPPVLLLDDCASALDAQTEAHVRSRLGDLRSGQTRIIVSHQPQSLAGCDWLVVLEHGHVVRQGRPHQVLAESEVAIEAGKFSRVSQPVARPAAI
jgi:ABC-type multidrug transport system fused ATPase/permease subunit